MSILFVVQLLTFSVLFSQQVNGQGAAYDCPFGWEEYIDHCYRFVTYPPLSIEDAKLNCQIDGAFVLSINSGGEHDFMVQQFNVYHPGQLKNNSWTSGRRVASNSMEFYWEGDGRKIESYFYWHNDSIPQAMTKDRILYNYNGFNWGWILGVVNEVNPYVCKISKEEVYKIQQHVRGHDYGVNNPDPATIERGPKFIQQPVNTIYEPASVVPYTTIECVADSYPSAGYEWVKRRGGQEVPINPSVEIRYTLINGKLIIHSPSSATSDDGEYQCAAFNKFGKIRSNSIQLTFGYLLDFPKSPRSPIQAVSYSWTSIECSPPSHYPEVLYTWYKNDIYNFIRPETKPYIFISHDGRLYFSEVTSDDVGLYYCLIYKPGQDMSAGKVSMPTELRVNEGSPGKYEPVLGAGFPLVYPQNPLVGDNIRIECWAHGTSTPESLVYSWTRTDGSRSVPLPPHARLTDHNRVIIITEVQLYDAGTYECSVMRVNGNTVTASVVLSLKARPYFILELKDQFADTGTDLSWRCDAGGDPMPRYFWLRNGTVLNATTIPPADAGRINVSSNVLTIRLLDAVKDNGMYQCAAENSHGIRYSSGQLKILSFAPSFAKYPLQPTQFATATGNTTLICQPEAAPYPLVDDIIWYKDGSPLNPSTDPNARVQKLPNGNLFIGSVEFGDGGIYRCHVTNPHGQADTTGNLTVMTTTTITLPPRNTVINVNKTAFLHCMASHNPQIDVTYTWYHGFRWIDFERVIRLGENKYEIWRNPNYKRGSGMYFGGLYIMNAQYEHTGEYTCTVESTGYSLEAKATVQIIGPPSEPAGVYIDQSSITTMSVVIQWKAGGDNGQPIISYVVEGFNKWEGFWKILLTNVQAVPDDRQTMRTNVTNLEPWSTYQIRMRAENVIGTSVPSIPSELFMTYPMLPDKAPDQVGGGGGKVGDLTISWKPLTEWEQNGAGIGYRVYWMPANHEEWDGIRDIFGNVGVHVQLVGESNYYLQYDVAVQAFNEIGFGPMSPVVRIYSAMALPTAIATDVRAQPYNATACLVHWVPVEDSREHIKGKLGGYRLSFWKEVGEIEETAYRVTIYGQASEGLVIGLFSDTPYYFDVMVWNEAGNGPKSQFFIQRTLRRAPINPPVEVKLWRRSDSAVEVWWRGVSTTQLEEPLEGYMVRLWYEGEEIKKSLEYDSVKQTRLVIGGLRPDVVYNLRVFGYSRGGNGTMSSPTKVFILGGSSAIQYSLICLMISTFLSLIR